MRPRRTLLVEGWRFLPHSFALVNQYQLLALRDRVRLLHRDRPFYRPEWRQERGLLDAEDERAIAEVPAPDASDRPDAVYRVGYPFDLSPSPSPRTLVFATSEFGFLPDHAALPAGALRDGRCMIVTPSRWSREGLLREGVRAARLEVVPHGADVRVFRPLPAEQRSAARAALGIDGFLFLSVGALTFNKGIGLLLKAFAAVLERHPDARLTIKGMDALYRSREFIPHVTGELTAAERERVQARLTYIGDTYSARQLASLYQCADAYVSPYLAEGFNLPVLEASACGTLAICTEGGPTDDFTTGESALRVRSRRAAAPHHPRGIVLQPDLDHLVARMLEAIEAPALRERARSAGPSHVAAGFTWQHAADRLLALAFPDFK
jgi:glycosyltransferase involved in cell wall biosynthesis